MGNRPRIVASQETPPSQMAGAARDASAQIEALSKRQKELEDRLRDSEARLKHYVDLFEHTPVAHFVLARDGTIVQGNLQSTRLLGQDKPPRCPARLGDFLQEESQADFAAFLERVFSGQNGASCEVRLSATPTVPARVVQIDAVADAAGCLCNATATNITASRAIEAAANEKLALLTNLIAHTPGILFQLRMAADGSLSYPYVSDAIQQMYGVTTKQVGENAAHLLRCLHPLDVDDVNASMLLSARTLAPWRHEYRMLLQSGEVIWRAVDAQPEMLVDGSVLWHGYTIDITERKRMEEALRQNEERWKLALEGAGDGVWDWDVRRNSVTYSTRWKEMLGYADEEIGNLPEEWFGRVHPDDVPITEANAKRLTDGVTRLTTIELRMRTKDGRWKWILSRGIVVTRDADGAPLRVVGTNTDITERKQMEEALRASEERWKFALEGAGDGVWDLNTEAGDVAYFSTRWKAMLGYADEDIPDLPGEWAKLVHPEDLPLATATRQMQEDGEATTTSVELRLRCKDGSWKWILSRGMVVSRDTDGKPLRIVGTNSDITRRKQMEEALRESEERWKFALEGAGEGVWDLNVQTNAITFSSRWKEMLGYTDGEIQNQAGEWSRLIHPEDLPHAAATRTMLQTGERTSTSIELRMRCKDGGWKWIHSRGQVVSHDDRGRPLRIVGTNSDITERRQMEESLRENEERWKLALEGAGHGVWDWDLTSNKALFSKRWKEILGYADDEIGSEASEWMSRTHPDDAELIEASHHAIVTQEKNSDSIEFRMRCKDGSWKWVLGSGILVTRNTKGQTLRMVGTLSDISQRKETEEALRLTLIELEERRREAERLSEAKSRFLNSASHDLRQPLYATRLFADALADGKLTAKQQSVLENLRLSVKAMSGQLEMLLDVSRLDMGKFEPQLRDIPLAVICRDLEATYEPIARKAGVSLRFLPGRGVVRTDAVLIGRLLGNLIDNAIKFASQGTVLVCARRSARGIRIEVRDNGPGIAPEHSQRIFDEYYQVANPARNPSAGLGLGLSIAQRIARLLDAPLTLKTRVGRGTVFAITLPAIACKPRGARPRRGASRRWMAPQ